MIHHRPDERAEHEEDADEARNDGAGVEKNFPNHQREADEKYDDGFPSREPGDEVPAKKQTEADERGDAGDAKAGRFHFDVAAGDCDDEEQRGEGGDPKCNRFKAARLKVRCNV